MKQVILVYLMIVLMTTVVFAEFGREEALDAIDIAENKMTQASVSGYPIEAMNASLTAAKLAFERAELSEKSTDPALSTFSYEDVLKYTNEVIALEQQLYDISDGLSALDLKLETYSEENTKPVSLLTGAFIYEKRKYVETDEVHSLLNDAELAFNSGRYSDANNLLVQAKLKLEESENEATVSSIVYDSSIGFLRKNLADFLLFSMVLFFLTALLWGPVRRTRIRKNISDLKHEKETLDKLIKKTQGERFVKGKISQHVYNTRMAVYKEKQNIIKEKLPVLEQKVTRSKPSRKK